MVNEIVAVIVTQIVAATVAQIVASIVDQIVAAIVAQIADAIVTQIVAAIVAQIVASIVAQIVATIVCCNCGSKSVLLCWSLCHMTTGQYGPSAGPACCVIHQRDPGSCCQSDDNMHICD